MNREQMIEAAAVAVAYARRGVTARVNETDRLAGEAVINAILPQVTTVEELEALPYDAKVVDKSGEVWARYYLATSGQRPLRWRSSRGAYGQTSSRLVAMGLVPLTVVWRPE